MFPFFCFFYLPLNSSDFNLEQCFSASGFLWMFLSQGCEEIISGISLHFSEVFHLFANGITACSVSSSGVKKSSLWLLLKVPQRPCLQKCF